MDRDNDFCIFALGEYLVCGQEGESVGTSETLGLGAVVGSGVCVGTGV